MNKFSGWEMPEKRNRKRDLEAWNGFLRSTVDMLLRIAGGNQPKRVEDCFLVANLPAKRTEDFFLTVGGGRVLEIVEGPVFLEGGKPKV